MSVIILVASFVVLCICAENLHDCDSFPMGAATLNICGAGLSLVGMTSAVLIMIGRFPML